MQITGIYLSRLQRRPASRSSFSFKRRLFCSSFPFFSAPRRADSIADKTSFFPSAESPISRAKVILISFTFSIVILFGLGWGTKENGSILYALYFGWAFLVLLFQLVEKIAEKWNLRFLVPLVTAGCTVAFAVTNIPAIIEMIRFAIQYYPL